MRILLTPVLFLLLCTGAGAQTWTGAANSNWFNAANWNPMTVPVSTSAVTIPGALSTYPTLTANVTVAGLTMQSGSALHLAGYTFTDNGSVSLIAAVVDGGGTFSVMSAATVSVSASTLTTVASILSYTGACNIYNNSFTGDAVISDAASQNSSNNHIDGNLFTGNLTLTHASATADLLEGFGGSGNNHVTGNALFNLTGGGAFYSSYAHGLQVDGNLTVSRTATGYTNLFRSAGAATGVGGNISYTNNVGGATYINEGNAAVVSVGGTINISANSSGVFHMYRVKNAVGGGAVSVAGSGNVDVRNDTLIAAISITGFTGSSNIYDNSFTGATTISDASLQNTANNYIDGNLFSGSLTLTHASATADMLEGYGSPSGNGNLVIGNAQFNLSGGGAFYSSYSHDLKVNGNFTVDRTAAGNTNLYRSIGGTAGVGGDFSYTNNAGGATYINESNSVAVPVAGTANINVTSGTIFHMYRMKNNLAGGTVSVSGATNLDVRNDTIKAVTSFTAYTGVCNILDNSFTGSTVIADAPVQNTGNNYIDGNLFAGNLLLTHASATADMYDGFSSPSGNGNHITGNYTINLTGAGTFHSSYSHPLQVDGNMAVSRTVSGITRIFENGSITNSVVGNLSYTNNAGGDNYINESNSNVATVNGTLNVSVTGSGLFHMYRMKNLTTGGTVSVAGSGNVDVRNDTLNTTTSITGYTGACNILDNSFTGNTGIADAPAQNTGNNYIDGNLFAGNLSLTHTSLTADMYDGFGSPSGNGNHVTGEYTVSLTGAGTFHSSYSHSEQVDGNMTVTRTAAGNTSLFENGSAGNSIGSAFSYTNNAGGGSFINGNAGNTAIIGGIININASTPGVFRMYRMKNVVPGGVVSVTGSNNVDVRYDTLLAALSITGYTGSMNLFDSHITGATLVADASTQSSGNNYVDGNRFAGSFTLVHSSAAGNLYDGYGSPSGNGNVVMGRDSIVNMPGAASLSISNTHAHRADSTFVMNAASGVSFNSLSFGGSSAGRLRQAGAQPFSIPYVYLSKTGGASVMLDTTLSVTNTLIFTSGYIASSPIHPLVFANNAAHTGAGNASHVTGPVLKAGNQAFTFPLGNGAYYSPAGITAPVTAADSFSAQYFPVQPHVAGYDSSQHDASINHISRREYWTISRVGTGTSNVKVILGYNQPASGQVTNMSQLRVAHWYNNGTSLAWHDEGNGGTTGNNTTGTVQSNNIISTFSPFTIASTTVANPLPVVLSNFSAQRVHTTALLEWIVQSEKDVRSFDIQRSSDGSRWTDISTVAAVGNTATVRTYSYTDAAPLSGKNFYRLRINDYSGSESYSQVRTVQMDGAVGDVVVYPNPVADVLHVSGDVRVATLTDITGHVVYRSTQAGNVNMREMPAGTYLLNVITNDGVQSSFKIVKQ